MRRNLLSGLVLAVAAVLVVVLSAAFDLELESVALLGAALGAVVALVPDRAPGARLAGFAAGFAVAWIGEDGEDGEGSRNWARALGGIGLLAAGGGVFAYRRRLL